jgi:hypothetical protein
MILLLSILMVFLASTSAYPSWQGYKDIEDVTIDGDFKVGYIDMNGDFNKEIIIKTQYGAGSNHYLEDLRIFSDPHGTKESRLELIFHVVTLDSTYGFHPPSIHNRDIVSEVEFTESLPENNGVRDIIVRLRAVYYKDDENKIVDREEDLGTTVYKWNGEKFVESD